MTVERAITDNLNKYMKLRNIGVMQLSEISGIPNNSVYSWVNGRRTPSLINAFILSQVLDITLNDLVEGADK